jgi:hypothetical protein
MARCLRELGDTDKASLILTYVVSVTSKQDEKPKVTGSKDGTEDNSVEETIFLPRQAFSAIRGVGHITEEATALRLWYMAAYAVESSPDERGRIRALSLLHASSEALQRRLKEADSSSEESTSTHVIEMLECVEDEARELFAPLDAMRKENRPRIELREEDAEEEYKTGTEGSEDVRMPYPTRNRLHRTIPKASFLPSAFA